MVQTRPLGLLLFVLWLAPAVAEEERWARVQGRQVYLRLDGSGLLSLALKITPEATALMGDKASARRIAQEAGVPVVPGTDALSSDDEAMRLVREGPDWDVEQAQVPIGRISIRFGD